MSSVPERTACRLVRKVSLHCLDDREVVEPDSRKQLQEEVQGKEVVQVGGTLPEFVYVSRSKARIDLSSVALQPVKEP